MNKNLFICIMSALFIFAGCNKNDNSKREMSNNIQGNVAEKVEDILQLEPVSEDGTVIQNAAVPKMDGEGTDLIKSVKVDKSANNEKDNNDTDIFFRAIYDNDTETIGNLLKNGFDIGAMNKNGENAVNVAISSGSYFVLEFLIENGANLNSTSDTGIPPLSQAISEYNGEAIDILLNSNKVDMYSVWGDMWTGSPLYIACSRANIYALEKMLENGADLNHDFSEYNAVPLIHYAINYKQYLKNDDYKELIAFLILNKININTKNKQGQTPLMAALKNGDIDGFNALIAGGADVSLKDKNGKTALDYAKNLKGASMLPDNEYEKIINLLSE